MLSPPMPLRLAISGSHGLIGSALLAHLYDHQVTRLVRHKTTAPNETPLANPDPAALEALDAVIHLAGEPVATGRWTKEKRTEILRSRADSTRALAKALAQLKRPPRAFLVASGAHYYGHQEDAELTEDSGLGSGFLPEVVRDWEAAADPARAAGIRTAHLRFGMVLSRRGGALPALLPTFRLGLGTILGRGSQWWPWISLTDTTAAILHVLSTDLRGPINLTSPCPATAADFATTLAHTLDRPLFARIPTWALRAMLGEKSEALTMSTRVLPGKLRKTGFHFQHPTLEAALKHELSL
jgi:uncharacterized protein